MFVVVVIPIIYLMEYEVYSVTTLCKPTVVVGKYLINLKTKTMKIQTINNKHYQECDVVLLKTLEKSNIWEKANGSLTFTKEKEGYIGNKELYILSNDEIKEGDWVLNTINKQIEQVVKISDLHYIKNVTTKTSTSGGSVPLINCKKIIATNDSSLKVFMWNPPNNMVDGEYSLPQIPQQFIEHFINEYNKGNVISKVLIEVNPELSELFKFQLTKGYLNKYGWYYSYSHSFDKNKDTYYTDKEGEKYLKNGGPKKLKELKFLITEYKHDKNLIKESKPYHSGLKVNSSNEISILTELKPFIIEDWEFERSSGYAGYRNIHTGEWIYEKEYIQKQILFEQKQSYSREEVVKLMNRAIDIGYNYCKNNSSAK